MAERPLVSIIVPVYNAEPYLERTVSRLKSQTYSSIEIILVDDGSQDASGALCDRFAEKDGRIRVMHQQNGGPSLARNAGTNAARGEYLTYVDSDDLVDAEYVDYLIGLARRYDAPISTCRILDCIQTESEGDGQRGEWVEDGVTSVEKILYQRTGFTNSGCAKLFHCSLREALVFPAGKYHEDLMLMYRVLYRVNRIAYGERQMYKYMHHPGSISHSGGVTGHELDLVEAADGIEAFARETCPVLLPAARARKFSCYSQALHAMNASGREGDAAEKLWAWMKANRMSVLLDKNCRGKNRLGAAMTFLGKRAYLGIYQRLGRKQV